MDRSLETGDGDDNSVVDTVTDATQTLTSTVSNISQVSTPAIACLGPCCKEGCSGPNQPRARSILDATSMNIDGQRRSLAGFWFDCYTWLTLCESRKVLLCYYCVKADSRKLTTFSTKGILIDSANGGCRDIPDSIIALYKADIDKDHLSLHPQMLPDAVKQYSSSSVPVKKVVLWVIS